MTLLSEARKLCLMDMTVNGEPLGRIDLELNYDMTPKTAQNFRYKDGRVMNNEC